MIKAGAGLSTQRNATQAGKEAAEAALRDAGITDCDFVMVFATVGYPQEELLAGVRSVTGAAPLAGGTGCGVISQQQIVEANHAVAVQVWKSDEMRFRTAKASSLKADSRAAGEQIARSLGEIPGDARALFVMADGISLNFEEFRQGFASVAGVGGAIPMIGGATNDNWVMKKTFQYCDSEAINDGVSVVLFSGGASVACEVNHGCTPIGHERTITRCEGNVIFEIDGKPAVEVLKEYLDEDAVNNFDVRAMAYVCLGFKTPKEFADSYDEYIIRFIPHKNDADGSVMIQTNVQQGSKVWMTRRDLDKMYRGVEELGTRLQKRLDGKPPKGVLHFDCAGRGMLMFSEEDRNRFVRRLQETLGRDVPWAGFYTAGEIAPVGGGNHFHNFTAVVAVIY